METLTTDTGQQAAAPSRGHFLNLLISRRDQILVFILLVAIWQVLSFMLGEYWVGTPWKTFVRLIEGVMSMNLVRHASYTISEAFVGFLIGGIPAVILPFALRRVPIATAIIDPFMVGGYGSPKLALAPLFVLWFGIGIESKVALVAFTVFFVVYFSTLGGIRALDPRLVQMAQVAGASERDVARYVIFPGAVPHIFAGIRIAMPYSIGGAIVAELISANRGLGYLIQFHSMNYDTTGVFVALAAAACVVFVANWAVNWAERRLLHWRPPSDVSLAASET